MKRKADFKTPMPNDLVNDFINMHVHINTKKFSVLPVLDGHPQNLRWCPFNRGGR